MSKAELEATIDDIFAPFRARRHPSLPVGGGTSVDDRYGAIVLEEVWIELYQLVDSLLGMPA